jgi:hypothetical protein
MWINTRLTPGSWKPGCCRGILIDVPAYKGTDRLPLGYVITPADVQGALARQGTREPGRGPGGGQGLRG